MRLIAAEGRGVLVLLRDVHMKMVSDSEVSPQILRQYGLGAQILSSLGLHDLVLLTNSPRPKVVGLEAYGLEIVERVPIQVPSNPRNERYLDTKRQKLGHMLEEGLKGHGEN